MKIVSGSGIPRPKSGVGQLPDGAASFRELRPTKVCGHPYSLQTRSRSETPELSATLRFS